MTLVNEYGIDAAKVCCLNVGVGVPLDAPEITKTEKDMDMGNDIHISLYSHSIAATWLADRLKNTSEIYI